WKENMWKRDGWIRPAKSAKRIRARSPEVLILWVDMLMWPAWRIINLEIFLAGSLANEIIQSMWRCNFRQNCSQE
ncbi:hypothetical protein KI387_023572, partial [Taxus chinensis]